MNAFICCTPYHVLISLIIKETIEKDNVSDIYIMNSFKDAKLIVDNIKKQNIFRNVYYVETEEFKENFLIGEKVSAKDKIFRYLEYRNLARFFDEKIKTPYEHIYYANFPGLFRLFISKMMLKRNKQLKISLFEDGFGGYTHEMLKLNWKKSIKINLFGFSRIYDKFMEHLVLKPELFIGDQIIEVKKIPVVEIKDGKLLNIMNKVFNYNKDSIDQEIIFLEQPFNNIPEMDITISEIINKIVSENNMKDIGVKLHPRSKSNLYNNLTHIETTSSWEMLCANNNIENKILISHSSTACLTPKNLFDKEPKLIFLYNIENIRSIKKLQNKQVEVFEKFFMTYRHSERIFVPKTLDELKKNIKSFIKI